MYVSVNQRPTGKIWLLASAIILTALTLRAAVTVVSPVLSNIGSDLVLSPMAIGVLGMLPTAAFGLFGFLTPFVIRGASLEKLIMASLAVGMAGQIARVFAPTTPLFLIFSVVAFAGLGAGNVLLPPLVKKHFPTKVGLMTAVYVTAISVGTALPAQLAVPVADATSWQFSLSSWAALSAVALVPWLVAAFSKDPGEKAAPAGAKGSGPAGLAGLNVPGLPLRPAPAPVPLKMNLWKSPTAWGLTLMFGCTSLNTYALFAWLPQILTESGLSQGEAGSMLALFGALGLPLSLGIPIIAAKMRNPFPAVVVTLSCFVAGYLGLLFSPADATWLWVSLTGLGPGTFPLALLLINQRTRTQQGAGALSGFGQGMGYALACAGPLFFGMLHDQTGSWTLPFSFLFASLVLLGTGAWIICRPRMLEDDFPAPRLGDGTG